MVGIYCYLKQEQTIRANKTKLNLIGKQLDKLTSLPNESKEPSTSDQPLNELSSSKSPTDDLPLTPVNESINGNTNAAPMTDIDEKTDQTPPTSS